VYLVFLPSGVRLVGTRYPRIVDKDLDASEFLVDLSQNLFDLPFIARIQMKEFRLFTFALDLPDQIPAFLIQDVRVLAVTNPFRNFYCQIFQALMRRKSVISPR
jgi:hypothetical protein